MGPDRSVIVIGGGIAALAAASLLASNGCEVCLLEARNRIGGRIFTTRDPDLNFPVELGAEFIHGRPPEIFNLLGPAGVETTEVNGESWYSSNDQLRPTDFYSRIDSVLNKMDDSGPDESFLEFINRTLSDSPEDQEIKRWAMGYVTGFNAADPSLVGVHWLVNEIRAEERIEGHRSFRCKNGYRDLIDLLTRGLNSLPVTICTGTVVRNVGWRRGHAEVIAENKTGIEKYSAPRLLITLPLSLLKEQTEKLGVVQFNPPLPRQKYAAMQAMEVGEVIRVSLTFKNRFWENISPSPESHHTLSNLSFLFSQDEWFPTWWTAMPEKVPLITGWAPFRSAQRLTGKDRTFVVDQCLQTLTRLLNIAPSQIEETLVSAHFHDWQTDPFSRGAYSYGKVGSDGAQAAIGSPLEETLFFAGEATDISGHNGTVHGAMASGYRAAREIVQSL